MQFARVVFLLALITAIGGPLGVLMMFAIDADNSWERGVSTIEGSVGAALVFFAVSFTLKRYALKKGQILDETQKPSA